MPRYRESVEQMLTQEAIIDFNITLLIHEKYLNNSETKSAFIYAIVLRAFMS